MVVVIFYCLYILDLPFRIERVRADDRIDRDILILFSGIRDGCPRVIHYLAYLPVPPRKDRRLRFKFSALPRDDSDGIAAVYEPPICLQGLGRIKQVLLVVIGPESDAERVRIARERTILSYKCLETVPFPSCKAAGLIKALVFGDVFPVFKMNLFHSVSFPVIAVFTIDFKVTFVSYVDVYLIQAALAVVIFIYGIPYFSVRRYFDLV